jgi:phenylpyruvate tautomerase PptA (4-oxalocrotonate tautomerase family)
MPTYQVFMSPQCLSKESKQRVAQAITATHHDVTGAANFFAQVIFNARSAEDYYLGGSPLKAPHLFVHGHIRARSLEIKQQLAARLLDAVADAAQLDKRYVWIYISDLQPEVMVEFGYPLPPPGKEAEWMATLKPEDLAYMQGVDFKQTQNHS